MDSAILTQQIRPPVYPSRTGIVLNDSTDRHVSVTLALIYTFQDFTYLFSLLDEHIFWLHRRICLIRDINCCWPIYVSAQLKLPAFFRRLSSVVMFSRLRFHTRCAERTMTETAKASTLCPRKKAIQACLKLFKISKLCTILQFNTISICLFSIKLPILVKICPTVIEILTFKKWC